ncbi:MAG: CCA tRNA nucleotidyltransferase [Acidobacteria bacterium]|nr:CCA tRNA nucleotidyltransferase [Acidobacteriota bacterium]
MNAAVERPGGNVGRAIDVIEGAARAAGARAFLVGGPVRDMLRGMPPRDLDIAIEGDAEKIARELATLTDGEIRQPGPFLTFKVVPRDAAEIDIATARRERYPHPGALPIVEPASIEEDLQRRDFSINAIALEIFTWTLVDPMGGVDDLRRGLLRVLHDRSFVDDPTRILRGLRFTSRLGLRWEAKTANLLADAIAHDALATVSRERVWRELIHASNEIGGGAAALLAIARSGALEAILGIPTDPAEAAALERFERERESFSGRGADATLVRLALTFAGATLEPGAISMAPMRERAREQLASIARDPRRNARALEALTEDDGIFDILSAMTAEERVVTALVAPAVRPLVERFERAAATRIVSSATELAVPPGPWIGRAIRATIRALFVRAIAPGEAAAFARRAALDYLRGQDRKE